MPSHRTPADASSQRSIFYRGRAQTAPTTESQDARPPAAESPHPGVLQGVVPTPGGDLVSGHRRSRSGVGVQGSGDGGRIEKLQREASSNHPQDPRGPCGLSPKFRLHSHLRQLAATHSPSSEPSRKRCQSNRGPRWSRSRSPPRLHALRDGWSRLVKLPYSETSPESDAGRPGRRTCIQCDCMLDAMFVTTTLGPSCPSGRFTTRSLRAWSLRRWRPDLE